MFNLFSDQAAQDSDLSQSVNNTAFIEAFHGYHEVGGGTVPYKKALDWMSGQNEVNRARIIHVCVIIFSKPKTLLFSGRTRSQIAANADVGQTLDPNLAQYVPHLTTANIQALTGTAKSQFVESRKDWHPKWRSINLSMCRRIAFMAVEHMAPKIAVVKQLKKSFNNKKPSQLQETDLVVYSKVETTVNILRTNIAEFKKHKDEWDVNAAKALFNPKNSDQTGVSEFIHAETLEAAVAELFTA